jgi:hypothetical protein
MCCETNILDILVYCLSLSSAMLSPTPLIGRVPFLLVAPPTVGADDGE